MAIEWQLSSAFNVDSADIYSLTLSRRLPGAGEATPEAAAARAYLKTELDALTEGFRVSPTGVALALRRRQAAGVKAELDAARAEGRSARDEIDSLLERGHDPARAEQAAAAAAEKIKVLLEREQSVDQLLRAAEATAQAEWSAMCSARAHELARELADAAERTRAEATAKVAKLIGPYLAASAKVLAVHRSGLRIPVPTT